MTKFLATAAVLLLAAAPAPPAEDFTGKWTGKFVVVGPDGTVLDEDPISLTLTHKGKDLTDTAGPSERTQWPIAKGVVDGNNLTFEVQSDGPLIRFTLAFAEGRLKGNAAADFQGQKLAAKVDAERAK